MQVENLDFYMIVSEVIKDSWSPQKFSGNLGSLQPRERGALITGDKERTELT